MSYNIWNKNRNPAAAIELIRREKPDILLLQEVNTDHFQYLITHLNSLYGNTPLSSEYIPEMKQAVLSHYPMLPIGADIDKGRAQIVRIETSFGSITILNVHIYNFPWQRRHHQLIELVKEDIATIQGPIILGGDLNTNDQSEAYQITERYLKNAHEESGCGLGFTFPSQDSGYRISKILQAIIRIDHIFYSDHFYARSSKTLDESGGSDHYPVVAELIPIESLWLSESAGGR
jgi:endonuclease/exonuclease/phosphatase (EEP) superfamily protein YafD